MQNYVSFFANSALPLGKILLHQLKLCQMLEMQIEFDNFTLHSQSNSVEEKVLRPLQQLVDIFQGPVRLCQKRSDKLMDYTVASQKLKQNRQGWSEF